MTIDINDYMDAALSGLKEQIDEAYDFMPEVIGRRPEPDFENRLAHLTTLVRTAADSMEILENYNGEYDRIGRWCFGSHPGRYDVQCRLCEVQRLCSEETSKHELAQKPGLIEFTCWKCDGNKLERVYDCLSASQTVEAVYEDGAVRVTGPIEIVEDHGRWYRCHSCKTSLLDWDTEDPVWRDDSYLLDWLMENRRQARRSRRVKPNQPDQA